METLSKEARLNELWEELLKQNPTNLDLRYIVEYVEPLREKAWQKLLEQNPTNLDLRYIVEYVEPLREKAGQKLLEQNPTRILKKKSWAETFGAESNQ